MAGVKDSLMVLFEKLESFLTTKTVVGEQIKVGDTTIIPVISVCFGLGSGGSETDNAKSDPGSGAGAGAKVAPTAIIVIKDDKVELLSIKRSGSLDKLIEMAPEIISRIKEDKNTDEK